MKTKMSIALLILLVASCSVSKKNYEKKLIGRYSGISQGALPNTSTSYFLELTDSNFYLKITGHDFSPECKGKWEYKTDKLVLACGEEKDLGIILSSGYMNQRKFTLNVKDKKILLLGKVILKRI